VECTFNCAFSTSTLLIGRQ